MQPQNHSSSEVPPNEANNREAERLVRALYLGMLGREPDLDGLAHWVGVICSGTASAVEVAELFLASEEYRKLHAVKLFVPPGHYYSPIVNPAEVRRYVTSVHLKTSDSVAGIDINRKEMVRTWHELIPFMTSSPFSANHTPPLHYYFDNPSYSWGDGSMLHAMLRRFRPKRLIEIGCGWSSSCTLDTVEKYLDGDCRITLIEPYPQLVRDLIPDCPSSIEILESPVQNVPLAIFESLKAGDVLFIDSTHVLRTGSDVCFELFDILPTLAPGVLVHFHDIFWPFEYPEAWTMTDNRSWNELYAVRAFLTQNDRWRIIMFNDYLSLLERPMIEATYPAFLRNSGGALWLQRK